MPFYDIQNLSGGTRGFAAIEGWTVLESEDRRTALELDADQYAALVATREFKLAEVPDPPVLP